MRTSEIQRMLFRMTRTGEVTSEAISGGLHKVDKAVDYFYLAVQISSPHANPDLKDLIRYDKQEPGGDAAVAIDRADSPPRRPRQAGVSLRGRHSAGDQAICSSPSRQGNPPPTTIHKPPRASCRNPRGRLDTKRYTTYTVGYG